MGLGIRSIDLSARATSASWQQEAGEYEVRGSEGGGGGGDGRSTHKDVWISDNRRNSLTAHSNVKALCDAQPISLPCSTQYRALDPLEHAVSNGGVRSEDKTRFQTRPEARDA